MTAQGQSNRWFLKNTCSAELIEIHKSQEAPVGRHREATVCLRSGKVSRYHACLGLTNDGKLWLKDLKSSNGTYVNETRIEPFELELVDNGAKLGFGLASIDGAEEEKDELIFWEVMHRRENDDDDKNTSLNDIEKTPNQVSAVVQNGGTFEFASNKNEIIEVSDEDIEVNCEKSKNKKVSERSFEPQPGTSTSEIEKILESFEVEVTKVVRRSNIEYGDYSVNEKEDSSSKQKVDEIPHLSSENEGNENNSNKKEKLSSKRNEDEIAQLSSKDEVNGNNSNEKGEPLSNQKEDKIPHLSSKDEVNENNSNKKCEDKKEKDDDSDMSDNDFSCSQIFHMSQIPDPVDFQKIKDEMAEMNYTEDPLILNPTPISIDDGYDNTQEIVDILDNDFDDTIESIFTTKPPSAECSTSNNLKSAKASPRKSSRLESRQPADSLTRRKSCLDSPKKKKLGNDSNNTADSLTRRKSCLDSPKKKKLGNDSNTSRASTSKRQLKRRHSSTSEANKVETLDLEKQMELICNSKSPNKNNVLKESKRNSRRSLEPDKGKKPKLDKQLTSSPDKNLSKESRGKRKSSLGESKASKESESKHRRSSVRIDKRESSKPEEKSSEKNVSLEARKKLTPSTEINKIKKPDLKKSLMTLRSNSDSFDKQKVSLVNNNRDSSDNRLVDTRLHSRPTRSKNISMEFHRDSSDNRPVDPRIHSKSNRAINVSVELNSPGSSANDKGNLSDNPPMVASIFSLPAPPCQLEPPQEIVQENYKRRPDPRLCQQMTRKQTFTGEVINERQTNGRVASYKIATVNIDKIINKILKWDTSWLEYQLTSLSFEPRVNESAAEKIPLKFPNFKRYFEIFSKLIFLETWESIFRSYVDSRRSQARVQPIVQGMRKHESFTYLDCHYDITAVQNEKGDFCKQDDLILVEYNAMGLRNAKMTFGLVQISKSIQNIKSYKYYAKIHFTVMVSCDLLINSNNGSLPRVIIQRVANLRTQIIMFKVLANFDKSPLQPMLLYPRISDFKIAVTHEKFIVPPVEKLNSQQQRSVLEAASLCTGDKPGIYTLIGPPGTGKTHTIVNILFQIIFNHYFGKAKSKPPMILLVAPSNAAVDYLITKIVSLKEKLREELKRKIKCVRIGPMTSISKAARCYTLQHFAERHVPVLRQHIPEIQEARKRKVDVVEFCKEFFGKDYHKELRISENILMENSNIILTTLGSCASNAKIIESIRKGLIHPTCCIIDEATQCHEPESLLPTMLGIDKIVMVGDPRQLNATILSKEASQLGFGESLFSRLVNNFEKARESPIQMLTTQYRMHPEICSFPNRKFYQGKLQSQPNPKNKLPDIIKPYLVFNCTNQVSQDDSDYTNPEEMRLIKKLLATIIQVVNNKKLKYSVGIITPYNAQKSLIHDNLKDIGKDNSNWEININTVDSFQGSEHDIVIISCVRESTNSFVQNVNRLNVALTRAKQALYIFGNSTLFRECRPLYDLREDARDRKVCLDINSRSQSMKDFHQYLCRQ
ncbi:unnamed protein product [Ceutorhynchus assimilis]|uniref:FHA domain-containing protein n=1 Tax=Ceutorhynchus assimilis TaxID=467358 RepID=A0A9N9MFX0_9CUCU|nr:unnamed protein product [Ceutorhynchus assimilis]